MAFNSQFSYIYSEVYLLNLWWVYQKIPKYFPRLKRFLSSLKMTVSKEFQPANAPSHLLHLWACQIHVVWKVETVTPITKRAIYWFYILLTCTFGFKLKTNLFLLFNLFLYYLWVLLYFLVLFISPTVLFQLTLFLFTVLSTKSFQFQ